MKRLVSLLVSVLILTLIYWQVDARNIVQELARADLAWLALAVGLVAPITLATALRLKYMVGRRAAIGTGESLALILSASVMNLVLPSKMGDVAKAAFLREHGGMGGAAALSIVVLEKANDVLGLLVWCLFGLAIYPHKDPLFWALVTLVGAALALGLCLVYSRRFASRFFVAASACAPGGIARRISSLGEAWRDTFEFIPYRVRHRVVLISTGLWLLHLWQIWLFMLALNVDNVDFTVSLGLTALAIFFGLLPLTFMGLGTRDAALIYLYAPYFAPAVGAALGALTALRYLVPAALGVPFFTRHLQRVRASPGT